MKSPEEIWREYVGEDGPDLFEGPLHAIETYRLAAEKLSEAMMKMSTQIKYTKEYLKEECDTRNCLDEFSEGCSYDPQMGEPYNCIINQIERLFE